LVLIALLLFARENEIYFNLEIKITKIKKY